MTAIQGKNQNTLWTYVGSDLDFQRLQEISKLSRLQVRLEHLRPEHLGDIFTSGYIVNQFHGQSSAVLKELSQFQSKGSLILNRMAWCERVLQRFPSDLLSEADLLSGGFTISLKVLYRLA